MEKIDLNPAISVIIPLYNAENYIADTINSVINQSFKNWELIIVDDGSIDNSLSIAQSFVSDRIKVYFTKNQGAAAARNYGFKRSRAQLIKFFDADDLISDKMLASQFDLANQYPNTIISASWGRFYNDDITTFQLNEEKCWKDMDPIDWICSSWQDAQTMTQPGIFLIPRQIINEVGLWDEKLNLVDDMEFFTKVILGASAIKFSLDTVLYYRSGMGNKALSGHTNRKAIESHYRALYLSSHYLLDKEISIRTKQCIANMWQGFVYEYYYLARDLTRKAESTINHLGGSNLKFPCGGKSKILNGIFGWKLTLLIKNYLSGSR